MANEYIGSLISLVSLSDIRYQGILVSIDPIEATVSLEKVRSLGTEGRKGNPSEEILPNDSVYDFVVFRASDVKDLQIESPTAVSEQTPMSDPAIVAVAAPTTTARPPPQQQQQVPPPPPPHMQQQQQRYPQQQQFQQYPPYPPQGYGGPPPPFPPYGYPPQNFQPGQFGPGGYGPPPNGMNQLGPNQGFGGPMNNGMMGPPPPSLQQSQQHHQQQQQPMMSNQSQGLTSPTTSSAAAPSPIVQSQSQPTVNKLAPNANTVSAAVSTTTSKPQQPSVPTTTSSAPAPVQAKAPIAATPIAAAAKPVLPTGPPKPRSYANPGPPLPVSAGPVVSSSTAPAPTSAPKQVRTLKKEVGDVEQLAKDMSRTRMSNPIRDTNGPGVGGSVFGLAGQGSQGGNNHVRPPGMRNNQAPNSGRQLHPYGTAPAPAVNAIPIPENDFDFQSSNSNFSKSTIAKEEEIIIPAPETFYNAKASFFDDISSDSKSKMEASAQANQRFDRGAERSRNLDTFGESGGNNNAYGRRGRGRYQQSRGTPQ